MKKTICKVEYNTECAEVIAKYTCGAFGEPGGYEETLCKTEDGKFFIYVNGGAESPYPAEDIKLIAKNKVDEWIAARGL